MQFRVLGEIGVVDDDGAVTPITANKPRALLAMLVLNANRSMSYPTLASALWGDAQPEVPYAALQEGRAALSKDDASRAATIFERALALWSADVLEALSDIPFAGDAARRLREL